MAPTAAEAATTPSPSKIADVFTCLANLQLKGLAYTFARKIA
jgi:hypothetical protein